MSKNLLIGLGVFLGVVAVSLFLVKSKPSVVSTSQPSQLPLSTPSLEPTDSSEREIVVSGREYSFDPSSITLKKGEKIKLTFNNVGFLPHDLVINELGVRTRIVASGRSDTVEFTAEGDETLTFYCSVGNHKNLGMTGEVIFE